MSLKTFDVPDTLCRVCYMTSASGGVDVTAESTELRSAFRVHVEKPVQVGDWVRVSGKVRMDPGLTKAGKPREKNLAYYHQPHDGSDKTHWMFFQMSDGDVRAAPPPAVAARIRAAVASLNGLLDDWNPAVNMRDLETAVESVSTAVTDRTPRVVVLDIAI